MRSFDNIDEDDLKNRLMEFLFDECTEDAAEPIIFGCGGCGGAGSAEWLEQHEHAPSKLFSEEDNG